MRGETSYKVADGLLTSPQMHIHTSRSRSLLVKKQTWVVLIWANFSVQQKSRRASTFRSRLGRPLEVSWVVFLGWLKLSNVQHVDEEFDFRFFATGSWTSPSTFQISVQGSIGARPPEIGHLRIVTLEAGNIRNRPPQSSATVGVYSPPLDGNFGPSPIRILALTAHDPLNSANVVRCLRSFFFLWEAK